MYLGLAELSLTSLFKPLLLVMRTVLFIELDCKKLNQAILTQHTEGDYRFQRTVDESIVVCLTRELYVVVIRILRAQCQRSFRIF